MCGFVGFRDFRIGRPAASGLDSALAAIRHRGPDGEGKLFINEFGFAHARLSIIDLTDAAKQPMFDASGRFVLLFNGEIYNYRELAETYFPNDPSLNRESDSAVLLAMYVRFGRQCLKHLNGMFAFAVVDLTTRSIFIARDRFGEKPLYWVKTDNFIAFASEIGALKYVAPDCEWSIDHDALLIYHGIGSVPAPYTIYRAARALRAACWMEFDDRGQSTEGTYWTMGGESHSQPRDKEEAIEGCRNRLLDAVRSRMVSDVPVGIFLSGGLDSGGILSLISSLDVPTPEALCIDFPDKKFSEFRQAAQTAEGFGARLHRSLVTPEEFDSNLENYFSSADQPSTDGFNTYFVSLHAKALGIKVWLSGVGGDELFGGYPSFQRIGWLIKLSRALQCVLPPSFGRMIERRFPHNYRWARMASLGGKGDAASRAYQCLRNPIPARMVADLMSAAVPRDSDAALRLIDGIYPDTASCVDGFKRVSLMESCVYMASQLLRDIDNFSMAHSIEVRAPFLDHRLFDYVFGLQPRFKLKDGRTKPLLVDALLNPLPATVAMQPKRGFTFPIESWLRTDLRASFEAIVLDPRNSDFWDIAAVRGLWHAYLAGHVHWSVPWQFYAFARWYRTHHA
jgi:asparagine synthase (glutamine-hydrolysing)